MKTLITGSMAFDTIMVFEDQFKNHILPDQTHILNVSFFVPQMTRFRGGCAGNIAYTLKLLGGEPVIMATVGEDFGPYAKTLAELEIDTQYLKTIQGQFTAQAYIITDSDNNQINAFHPGAMNSAHENQVAQTQSIEYAIVGPDGHAGMLQHCAQLAEQKIPFIFDPGQQTPLFDGDQLRTILAQANCAVLNDYEAQLVQDKCGCSVNELAELVEVLIVTRGAGGSEVYQNGAVVSVPVAPIGDLVDPTGCGDAYRAGLLIGLDKGLDWETCAKLGSVCGAIKIEQAGTQQHEFTHKQFAERYAAAYGQACPLFDA